MPASTFLPLTPGEFLRGEICLIGCAAAQHYGGVQIRSSGRELLYQLVEKSAARDCRHPTPIPRVLADRPHQRQDSAENHKRHELHGALERPARERCVDDVRNQHRQTPHPGSYGAGFLDDLELYEDVMYKAEESGAEGELVGGARPDGAVLDSTERDRGTVPYPSLDRDEFKDERVVSRQTTR
ncbi:hypothetical protein DL766_008518 [Monosporascus sp. MC13-8B]|uniref:Uncharacterized protein n=1 Tax=Monosporascus cannonballus TaxID=155416 RepID=A0ABY0HAS0_9PEZI|nr:hypothetical protein DL763_006440 [Monosporascus cannonballus]RYO89125.1 hypothetical protein DL762_003405 [Monosporascus cannonballus]RYP19132.1 hypothetical protein DL766_008518 [Monosporascus sp. MC13-8B]